MTNVTLKNYTDSLPRNKRGAVRDYFMKKFGISERNFYYKLKANKWDTLERPIVEKYLKPKISKDEKK